MRIVPVDAADIDTLTNALRRALDADGPAIALGVSEPGLEAPEGTAVVMTTSGSTGIPKSVVLPASALVASATATARVLGEGAWLLGLPAGYVAGLQVLVRSVVNGHDPHIVPGRFEPTAFVAAARAMPADRPRFTSLVPAQLATLMDAAVDVPAVAATLAGFAAILVGGQSTPPALLERAREAGVRVVRTYGSTETSGGCVYDGVPLPGVDARIIDGEIRLSGPVLATGYLGDPDRTAAAFPVDAAGARWYRTGDAGVIDDGMLRVRGRLDNVIISGGVNVSLDRVEQLIQTMPGLEHAVVVGIPDRRWGEASVIVIARTRPAQSESEGAVEAQPSAATDLLERARHVVGAQLGAAARPARLFAVDELPRLASGKPDREALRTLVTAHDGNAHDGNAHDGNAHDGTGHDSTARN